MSFFLNYFPTIKSKADVVTVCLVCYVLSVILVLIVISVASSWCSYNVTRGHTHTLSLIYQFIIAIPPTTEMFLRESRRPLEDRTPSWE